MTRTPDPAEPLRERRITGPKRVELSSAYVKPASLGNKSQTDLSRLIQFIAKGPLADIERYYRADILGVGNHDELEKSPPGGLLRSTHFQALRNVRAKIREKYAEEARLATEREAKLSKAKARLLPKPRTRP